MLFFSILGELRHHSLLRSVLRLAEHAKDICPFVLLESGVAISGCCYLCGAVKFTEWIEG